MHSVLVHSSGLSVHAKEGAVRGNELAESRDKLQQAVTTPSLLDKLLVADPRDHPGLPRSHYGKRVQQRVESRPLVRISPVEKRARFVADEFDERRDAECLSDVVHDTTRTAMLTRTRVNAVTTAMPGTWPVPSPLMVTSRS